MRHILLHGHIFKNAGTSIDWALARCLGEGFSENKDEVGLREQGAPQLARLLAQKPALRAFSSHHLPAPLPVVDACTLHPLYLLRHPLQRCRSVYTFERRQQADTRGARAAKELDFQAYLAWRMQADVPNVIRSYQSAYLAGDHRPFISDKEMADCFARAQRALCELELLGLVERFDESMVLFEYLLRPHFPDIDLSCKPQNQSAVTSVATAVTGSEALIEEMGRIAGSVIDSNGYDLALYRLAQYKLDTALAGIPDFSRRLSEFQNRCNVIPESH
ncbi:MAG: hypothetical protein ACK5ME_13175 [Parahaliea sp.]